MSGGMTALSRLVVLLALGASSVEAQEVFRIGAPTSLSGRYAAYGSQGKNGIEMAVEAWRKVRGNTVAGRPIEVLFRDTQSNNATTVSLMSALIQTDKANVIIGPDGSNVAAAAVPPWKKLENRPIWIMPAGSSDVIEKEVGPDPYFFHTYAWSYHYHQTMSQAIKTLIGTDKKVALIYSDGAYGRAHIDDAIKHFQEAGFNIVASELVREGAADFNPTLVRLRARQPDVLYVLVQTNDAVQLAKQIRAAGMNVPYLVGTAQVQLEEWQNALGDTQACWIGVTTWVSGLKYPGDKRLPELFPSAADFEKTWVARHKSAPDFLEVGYYLSTILAMLAADETKSVDREVMKDWLAKQQFDTPLGSSKFEKSRTAQHQAFGTMVVFQRQKGSDGKIGNAILFPERAATGKPQSCSK